MTEKRWLLVCAALASGEWLAMSGSNFAEAWPVAVLLALLAALWGFGLALPGWWLVFVFAAGTACSLHSAVAAERGYRDRPWMRQIEAGRRGRHSKPRPLAGAVRSEMSRRMGVGLEHSPSSADINRAILLGERRRLNPAIKRKFVESGTIHVFAISGLHVMVIARFFCLFTAFLGIPLRFRALAAIPLLWIYVWLVDMPPSAVRAALMASIYFAAPLFWRRPNAITAWSLTFLAVHLYSPGLIGDVGSQLSFVVMLAIILAARMVQGLSMAKRHVLVALAAWASGVPIIAHTFGVITPGGLLANFALVPAAGAAVVASMTGVALSWVCVTAAEHANNLAALITGAMAGVSEAVASLPWSNFEISRWGLLECAAWYAMLAACPLVVRTILPKRPF
jgi:ComEC/Rec2-related protein